MPHELFTGRSLKRWEPGSRLRQNSGAKPTWLGIFRYSKLSTYSQALISNEVKSMFALVTARSLAIAKGCCLSKNRRILAVNRSMSTSAEYKVRHDCIILASTLTMMSR